MEFRHMDDFLFADWDDSAVDSKFFDSLLRPPPFEACGPSEDALEAFASPHGSNDESSCSSAPSFASCHSCSSSDASQYPQLDPSSLECLEPTNAFSENANEGARILASDPLLKTFLESGRRGVSRCFFFRSPNSQHLVVAQSLAAVANGRRFYDNLNMLEGLGLLKRGPVTVIEGARHRLFTWYGNSFMTEDFRRIFRHGEETGLAAAVRAVEAGRQPVPDRFTSAVSIDRQEATTYALEKRKPRGKCPLNVGIQRVLVILLAASTALNMETIVHLLQLPYPDVNLQRRYFYIRDVLLNFSLARISKLGDSKMSFFEYCGPKLFEATRVVPLFILKENVLTPLRLVAAEACSSPQPQSPALSVDTFCLANDIPASLMDSKELSPLPENVPPGAEEMSDTEDLLMRTSSNASSVLHRTDTLLPWTNSS